MNQDPYASSQRPAGFRKFSIATFAVAEDLDLDSHSVQKSISLVGDSHGVLASLLAADSLFLGQEESAAAGPGAGGFTPLAGFTLFSQIFHSFLEPRIHSFFTDFPLFLGPRIHSFWTPGFTLFWTPGFTLFSQIPMEKSESWSPERMHPNPGSRKE